MKSYSSALTAEVNNELRTHLIRKDGQEDLCFATYSPCTGSKRFSGLIAHPILPDDNDRLVHGNAEFFPDYLTRAIQIATERSEGLAFLHSHPFKGWQNMSEPDIVAECRLAPTVYGATNLPLLGLTISKDGIWSARFWIKDKNKKRTYDREWCDNVRLIDSKLSVYFNDNILKPNIDFDKQLRTVSSWGNKVQEDISRLKIGIVGLGSVGSVVAEILSRTGVSKFTLIDFDNVEIKNLDRTLGVYESDVGCAKVKSIAKSIRKSSTSPIIDIDCVEYSICEEPGYRAALNCDAIFSCVDRPWPRQILNFIAYSHLIPVIDGGIYVKTNSYNTEMKGATWRAHIVGYKRACLECIGQYSTSLAMLEKEGLLEDPEYIKGMSNKIDVNNKENVFAFSTYLAAMEVSQFLSQFIAPCGISDVGQQLFNLVPGKLVNEHRTCHSNCYFQTIIGKGDLENITPHSFHKYAEHIRNSRIKNSN